MIEAAISAALPGSCSVALPRSAPHRQRAGEWAGPGEDAYLWVTPGNRSLARVGVATARVGRVEIVNLLGKGGRSLGPALVLLFTGL